MKNGSAPAPLAIFTMYPCADANCTALALLIEKSHQKSSNSSSVALWNESLLFAWQVYDFYLYFIAALQPLCIFNTGLFLKCRSLPTRKSSRRIFIWLQTLFQPGRPLFQPHVKRQELWLQTNNFSFEINEIHTWKTYLYYCTLKRIPHRSIFLWLADW